MPAGRSWKSPAVAIQQMEYLLLPSRTSEEKLSSYSQLVRIPDD